MSSNNGVPTVSPPVEKRTSGTTTGSAMDRPAYHERDQVNDPSVERNRRSWPPSHHLYASARPTMAA